jgi:hypothetical protein
MLPQTKSTRSTNKVDVEKITKLGWRQEHKLEDYIDEIKNGNG